MNAREAAYQAELQRLRERQRAADMANLGKLYADFDRGLSDSAASMLSSMVAAPVAGIAGLASLPWGAETAAGNVRSVQDALTYRPRNDVAQRGMENIGQVLEPIARGVQGAGDMAYEASGNNPFAGAAGQAGAIALLEALPFAGKIARRAAHMPPGPGPRSRRSQLGKVGTGKPRMTRAEAEAAGYWHPVGDDKRLPRPVHEFSREVRPAPEMDVRPHKEISPEQLQGKTLIPALGDRTDIGSDLLSVSGKPLAEPVRLQGGHGYMRQGDESVWASTPVAANQLNNRVLAALEEGRDPALVYLPQKHGTTNFSLMSTDALLEQLRGAGVSKTAKVLFDRKMRKLRPEWKGIDDPGAMALLESNGEVRHAFTDTVNLEDFQRRGFPNTAETRFALTDPNLMDVPLFHGGQSISAPTGRILEDPKIPHRTYASQLEGQYLGGIEQGVPGQVLFPDFYAQRRAAGAPQGGADARSLALSRPFQDANQSWVDGMMEFLSKKP